jgi:Zn finger protein HypA/HybF involved in hydrogenase expression
MNTQLEETKERHDTVPKTRRCLSCGRSFPSEWAGERVCRNCKSTEAWRRG